MTSRERLALVADNADVIGVADHAVQVGPGQFLCAAASLRACSEPEVGHGLLESVDRVVAGGIHFEGLLDQRSALFVDGDAVDLAPVVFDAHVAVADGGAAVGAAHLRLVAHLDFDVLAGHPHLDFVDDVGDRFHGVGHDAFAEVFFGGDELDAHGFESSFSDDGVTEVAECARAHVDDHQRDVGVFAEVGEQLFEDRAFVDGLRGCSWLDELLLDDGSHSCGLGVVGLTLGSD
ncbi:hypothetical protein UG54_02090 [Gordonia sihwensis]|nr:hypothetical protein UG54_02090 [Gordonia sihwensis]